MEGKNEMDNFDDVMLPGFRFHPTDEELVGFYLKKKVQKKSLPIEIIKQVDIYKYDPWDLPKMASTGEKELYFYCQRDRKYRNSARPNRVTRDGFWKATGTDRPIYSSNGKCIGLKKSLVFYRGRAAKGIKTDWMMHEFRLPSFSDSPLLPRKLSDKTLPPAESWAICRIFKKNNSQKPSSRSHPWITQFPEGLLGGDVLPQGGGATAYCNQNLSCAAQNASIASFSASDIIPIDTRVCVSNGDHGDSFKFSTLEASSSMLWNPESERFEETHQQLSGFSNSVPQAMQGNMNRGIGFPFSMHDPSDAWKSTLLWDSSSPPCPIGMSTNKCYT